MKTSTIIFIILGLLLVGGVIGGVVYFSTPQQIIAEQDQTLIVQQTKDQLDFCTTEQECKNYLISQGMSPDYLTQNNIKIICENEICYAEK